MEEARRSIAAVPQNTLYRAYVAVRASRKHFSYHPANLQMELMVIVCIFCISTVYK